MSPSASLATAPAATGADAVGGEGDGPADDLGDGLGDRGQREFGLGPALRPAEMREQNDLGALVGEFRDGRRDALDTGCVGHLAVGDRHVEVDAYQHPLASDVADLSRVLNAAIGVSFPC